MAFCSVCGSRLEDTATFCNNCGAQRIPSTYQHPPVYAPQPVAYVPRPGVPGRGMAIASLVTGVIGLFCVFYMLVLFLPMLSEMSRYGYAGALGGLIGVEIVYAPASIMAVCFASSSRNKGFNGGIGKAGMITGTIGLSIYVAVFVFALVVTA